MWTKRLLINRNCLSLDSGELARIEASISSVQNFAERVTLGRLAVETSHCMLLIEGLLSRYIDDSRGRRQLVTMHMPGEFVDLHNYPLRGFDHGIVSITPATVAYIPHFKLDEMISEMPVLGRKLWIATLIEAAIHRVWLFRNGRLDAAGRIAHFLSEINVRLMAVGLSDGRRFPLGLLQTDLAEICGLTSVHVNRVMRELRESGLCTFRNAVVEIPDAARLAARGQFTPEYLCIDLPENVGASYYKSDSQQSAPISDIYSLEREDCRSVH